MRRKYDYIQVDKESVRRMANNLNKTLPQAANVLEAPTTMDELHLAVKKGNRSKLLEVIDYFKNSLKSRGRQQSTTC